MESIQQKSARKLVARREQLKEMHESHAAYYQSQNIDAGHQLARYSAEIREIETELVRRAMQYEDRTVTLPQHMLDTVKAGVLDIGNIGLRTVYELMVERNGLLEERDAAIAKQPDNRANLEVTCASRLIRIDNEVERRVVEVEDRDAKARRGFVEQVRAS